MLKAKFQQWLSQRFQFDKTKKLKQRDVLIFIYQQGYLYLVLILITFIAGVNYANNLILGFCFLISAILCISFYLTFKQLHLLEIEVILPEVGQVSEQLTVRIHLKSEVKTSRHLYFNVDGELKPILLIDGSQVVDLSFIPKDRGLFKIPSIQVYSTYPLGLVRTWTYLYLIDGIWIAPQSQSFQNEFDTSSDSGLPDMDEFRELRNYQIGDSLQTISWKQAARGQGLYVKQFEEQTDLNVITIDYQKMPSPEHEERLRLMMGLIESCEQKKTPYSVLLKDQVLEKGCGEQHLINAKLILAQA